MADRFCNRPFQYLFLLACLVFGIEWARANVVGVDTQNFNPTNDGLDYVSVQSTKTLTPGLINLGLFFNYAVNSLPNYADPATGILTNFHDSLLSSDLNFGLGITDGWEVGMSMPALLYQNVQSDVNANSLQFNSTGVTEFRLMSKLRFLGNHNGGLAGILSSNFNLIQNDPFQGSGAGPTLNLELAGDTKLGAGLIGALNLGYRLRSSGAQIPNIPIEPFGNEYIASTALSYHVQSWNTKLISEIFASLPATQQQNISNRSSSTAEGLLGLKWDINRALAFHFGGGAGLLNGVASPQWRIYTGLNWVIGPLFAKPKQKIVRVAEQQPKDAPVPESRLKALAQVDSGDPFAGPPKSEELFIARDILFEFDSDQLQQGALDLLQRLVVHLHKPPGFISLSIEGHTDSIGGRDYNVDLSQRRANRVRNSLIAMGLPPDRVVAIGFGASQPIANNGNFQGRAQNRRVELKIRREKIAQ